MITYITKDMWEWCFFTDNRSCFIIFAFTYIADITWDIRMCWTGRITWNKLIWYYVKF